MKLKSLLVSIILIHVFALGLAWIVIETQTPEKAQNHETRLVLNTHVVALPSSNLAYPVLALFGKSYIQGEQSDLMSEIEMDSLDYSGWNPAFYQPYQRKYTDVYSLEGLSMWKP